MLGLSSQISFQLIILLDCSNLSKINMIIHVAEKREDTRI